MEDVIEERSIAKLCGYVLCNNPVTLVINQRYHISTKSNKVYDVSRRKNFCSSRCYGATNFLLEQMFSSPLWLRDKEEAPVFRLLPAELEIKKVTLGDEINLGVIAIEHCVDDTNDREITKEKDEHSEMKETAVIGDIKNEVLSQDDEKEIKSCKNVDEKTENKDSDLIWENKSERRDEMVKSTNRVEEEINEQLWISNEDKSSQIVTETKKVIKVNMKTSNEEEISKPPMASSVQEIDKHKTMLNVAESLESTMKEEGADENLKHKKKKPHEKKSRKHSKHLADVNLAARVNQSFQEWITEDTIRLVLGDELDKHKVLENIAHQNKYGVWCKKLQMLQIKDEKAERASTEKPNLKSVPQYAILQEEGKKLELKVRRDILSNISFLTGYLRRYKYLKRIQRYALTNNEIIEIIVGACVLRRKHRDRNSSRESRSRRRERRSRRSAGSDFAANGCTRHENNATENFSGQAQQSVCKIFVSIGRYRCIFHNSDVICTGYRICCTLWQATANRFREQLTTTTAKDAHPLKRWSILFHCRPET